MLNIDAGKVTAHVSPTVYGPMTEEINGLASSFTHTFPPYSVSVLSIGTK